MCMSFRTYGRDVNPIETDTKGRVLLAFLCTGQVTEIGRPKCLTR